MVKVVEKAKGQRWMYQGNLVEILELNGCLATVKVVDEPSTRSFAVGRDDLVDLAEWRSRVASQDVEAPADLVEQVEREIRLRGVDFGRGDGPGAFPGPGVIGGASELSEGART